MLIPANGIITPTRTSVPVPDWKALPLVTNPKDFDEFRPPTLRAVDLAGCTGAGRTNPLIVECHGVDGHYVVKLHNPMAMDNTVPWERCLARELVGSMVALRLGLDTPAPAFVNFGESFINLTSKSAFAERIRANAGLNFGSKEIPYALDEADGFCDEWTALLCFDAMAYNGDRITSNKNVLCDGEKLFAIDHGSIYPEWSLKHDTAPTHGRSLYNDLWVKSHPAYAKISGRGAEFAKIAEWRELITPEYLVWVRSLVPSRWASTTDMDELFAFLQERHNIVERQGDRLKGLVK